MTTVRTSTYDGTLGNTIAAGDAGANFTTMGGTGTATYVAPASGFTGTGTVAEYTGVAVKKAGSNSITTWSAWAMDGEFRMPTRPTGGLGVICQVSIGATRMARFYLGTGGLPKIDGLVGGASDQGVTVLSGGNVYKYLWQGDRASGVQSLYLWNDSGYFEFLSTACGTTTGTLICEEGVAAAGGTVTVQLNDTHLYDALQTPPASGPPGLVSQPRAVAPQVDGFYIKVETSGMTKVRAKIYEASDGIGVLDPLSGVNDPYVIGNYVDTTADVTVPATSWSQIHVDGLDRFTHYGYQIECFDGSTWAEYGLPGFMWTTWPKLGDVDYDGPPPPFDFAARGCELDSHPDRTQSHVHLRDVYRPHWQYWTGDEIYGNPDYASAARNRDMISQKLNATPGLAWSYRLFGMMWKRLSDHDTADGNGGYASANNRYSYEALLDTAIVPELIPDLGGDVWERGAVYQAFHGPIQFLSGDFRTTYRMDPMGADVPTKYATHPMQEAWFLDALTDWDALGGVTIIIEDEEWVGTAADQGVVGVDDEIKKDHWARYPDQRGRYDVVLAGVQVTCIRGDYHGGAATSKYALADDGVSPKHASACTHFCCNGTNNNSGNVRIPDEHNYEQTYNAGSQVEDGTPSQLYTQVHVECDPVVTITMRGIDANTGDTVMEMVDVHDGSGHAPYVPPAPQEVLAADGASLTDSLGRFWVDADPVLGHLPAKLVASSVARGLDGELEDDDIDAGPMDLRIPMVVNAYSREEREQTVSALFGMFGRKRLRDFTWAADVGLSPTWHVLARQDAAVVPDDVGQIASRLLFTPHAPTGKWRSLAESQWELMLDEDGTAGSTKAVTPLAHSRAPIDDAILRFTGPMQFVNMQDGRTGNGFHWGIPNVTPSLNVGEYLIVDCKGWTAHVVDHDTWKASEGGILHNEGMYRWGPGSALLTLVPDMVDSNPFVYSIRVQVNISGGMEDVTKLEIKAYGATYKPVRIV